MLHLFDRGARVCDTACSPSPPPCGTIFDILLFAAAPTKTFAPQPQKAGTRHRRVTHTSPPRVARARAPPCVSPSSPATRPRECAPQRNRATCRRRSSAARATSSVSRWARRRPGGAPPPPVLGGATPSAGPCATSRRPPSVPRPPHGRRRSRRCRGALPMRKACSLDGAPGGASPEPGGYLTKGGGADVCPGGRPEAHARTRRAPRARPSRGSLPAVSSSSRHVRPLSLPPVRGGALAELRGWTCQPLSADRMRRGSPRAERSLIRRPDRWLGATSPGYYSHCLLASDQRRRGAAWQPALARVVRRARGGP